MEDEYRGQLRFGLTLIIFWIIQVVLVSLLGMFISKFFQTDEVISTPRQGLMAQINGISEVIPEDYSGWSRMTEWALFNAILENNEGQGFFKNATSSYIREGTVRTQRFGNGANYARMVVDVPGLLESYEIFLQYFNNDDLIDIIDYDNPKIAAPCSILCLEKSEIIYPDFNCRESANSSTRQEIVFRTLDYFEFKNFVTSFKDGDWSTIYISPVDGKVSNNIKQSYIQEVKDAIDSLGISPDIFSYQVIDNLGGAK